MLFKFEAVRGLLPIPLGTARLTVFGKATLSDRYLLPGESYQDMFARVASAYADDDAPCPAALRLHLATCGSCRRRRCCRNGGTKRGLPISCFLNEANDSLEGIVGLWNENVWLAARGGGIGSYWGNLRSIGEKVGMNGKTSGVVPFIRVMDSLTLAISQGSLRRGSAAVYLPVSHPEIEEFIEIRRPTGGDPNRKALNLHHGLLISDAFMRAVENDEEWALTSPKDGAVLRKVSARALWIRILTARIETGEPYLVFVDHVNNAPCPSTTSWPASRSRPRTCAARSRCRPASTITASSAPRCAACPRSTSRPISSGTSIRPSSRT